MPRLARRNYLLELRATCFVPFILTGVETGVASVTVKNAFEGVVDPARLDAAVAIVGAAKALANIASFVWVRLGHTRDKVRFTVGIQWLMLAVVASLAVVPRTEAGMWAFAGIVVLSRVVWAGFLTLRSTMWRANYARSVRARITGKFATVQVVAIGALGVGFGAAMDLHDQAFRVLIPLGCLLGVFGIRSWSRLRVRGHRSMLLAEAKDEGADRPSFNPLALAMVLVRDRGYRRYMGAMFTLGLGNLMIPSLLAIVVRERFEMGYLEGILVTGSIPMLVMPLAIPAWASLLDRTHVARFRMVHSWAFIAAHACLLIGVQSGQVGFLYLGSVVLGTAFAGGALAWTLGHLDFAPPEKTSQYMGVHVTLTGVRGLIAPFLGVVLYRWFEGVDPGAGSAVFGLAMAAGMLASLMFARTARGLLEPDRPDPLETTPPSRAGY